MNTEIFACPLTKLGLTRVALAEARAALATEKLVYRGRHAGFDAEPIGETEFVLLRSDRKAAYPIIDDIPILLGPEILTNSRDLPAIDLHAPQYEEAYLEMDSYNEVGRLTSAAIRAAGTLEGQEGFGLRSLGRIPSLTAAERGTFPEPHDVWMGTRCDIAAEIDCYEHLAPVAGKRIVQVGGSGDLVQRFLLGGSTEGLLVTPMIGEARLAMEVSRMLGVDDRFRCVIGVGEELPIADNMFDGCISGATVHHMETELAFPEINRILRPGGKFACFEPWRAPLYNLGVKIFGKREAHLNAHCRPMNPGRVSLLSSAFGESRYVLHGTLSRYPLIVWDAKLHMPLSQFWAERIARWDDRICNLIPRTRSWGSGLAILATKTK